MSEPYKARLKDKDGNYIYPQTIPDAVVDPESQESITESLKSIKDTIPTKTSQLTEDSGFAYKADISTEASTRQAADSALDSRVTALEKGGSGSGVTLAQKTTLINVIKAIGAFKVEDSESLIEAFETAWNSGSSETVTVSVSGSTMYVTGFTAASVSQSGTALNII